MAKGTEDTYLAQGDLMTINARVQKHRDKLRAYRRRRLDVHLPGALVEAAILFARQHDGHVRNVVYSALREYLTHHGAILTDAPRR